VTTGVEHDATSFSEAANPDIIAAAIAIDRIPTIIEFLFSFLYPTKGDLTELIRISIFRSVYIVYTNFPAPAGAPADRTSAPCCRSGAMMYIVTWYRILRPQNS
jgi:hypothetical protein